ncbi:MAG: hypothetical protein GOMPHAMPRED_007820 [Gomphillus americanus]|uniref:Uncharacterized protein n=1 Tax=Gomphillus americanus TaxID=1940652 RepID=A0A8H3EWQ6_9LECA|nr:MAG: hypothetical protein GOMPHAMPRED_007820 [Gomphillus americanus]
MQLFQLLSFALTAATIVSATTLSMTTSKDTTVCKVTRTSTVTAATGLTKKYFLSRGTPAAPISSTKSPLNAETPIRSLPCKSTSTVVTTVTELSNKLVARPVATCGVPVPASATAPSSGQIICPAGTHGKTSGYTRVEGSHDEGLIFEGCVQSRPGKITTKSGGTHQCNGLNNGANPLPGATALTQLNAAAAKDSFKFDGYWRDDDQDFLIQNISETSIYEYNNDPFWQIFSDLQLVPAYDSGCQTEINSTQELLWTFREDSYGTLQLLKISPQTLWFLWEPIHIRSLLMRQMLLVGYISCQAQHCKTGSVVQAILEVS